MAPMKAKMTRRQRKRKRFYRLRGRDIHDVGSPSEASSPTVLELPHDVGEVHPDDELCLDEATKKKKRGKELVLPRGSNEVVVEEDAHLCTSFCDFLMDLSSQPWQSVDSGFPTMVEYALENCEPNYCNDSEDTYFIELRGLFGFDIGFRLKHKLCIFSRTSIKYLNFIVGCKAHGIGNGYLRNKVLSLLKTDNTIKCDWESDVSVVSVEIDKERDYNSVPWCLIKCQQPQIVAEHSQENEPISSFSTEANKMSSERNEKGPIASSYPLDTIISEPGGPPFSLCDGNEDHDRPSAAASAGSYLDQVPPLNVLQNFEDFSEDVFLCTVVCDFLAGREKPSGDNWNGVYPKVLAALEKSCSGFCNDDIGSCTIDLRGRFADEAKRMLIAQLNDQPSQRYLRVIVGCKLHGIGDGKLRNIVCELLELIGIKPSSTDSDSIITIQLDGRNDYTPRSWICQPLPDVAEDSDDDGSSGWAALMPLDEDVMPGVDTLVEIFNSSMEEKFLCTFVCDFLSDLPTPPGQWWDKKTTRKVVAGLEKCYRSASVEDTEEILSVDIRGQDVDAAIKDIWNNLYPMPTQKYLNLIVGCEVHGIGKGTLKNAIIDKLAGFNIKRVPETKDFVISIEVGTVYMQLIKELMNGTVPHGIGIDYSDHSELSENFLCAILCDLIFDIPEQLGQSWGVKSVVKVLGALKLCDTYFCTQEDIDEGTYAIDLRGQPADDSESELINNLIRWSSHFKRLNFIVGCTRHGVGEGKLRDMVSRVLNRDTTIKWELVHKAIISVELDREKDYYLLKSGLSKVSSAP